MQQSDFIFLNINLTYFNPILGLLIIQSESKDQNFIHKNEKLFL